MTGQNLTEPFTCFGDGVVHAFSQFLFQILQLCLHPFSHRLPKHDELSISPPPVAHVREAKEVESLGLALATAFSSFGGKPSELDHARFLGM